MEVEEGSTNKTGEFGFLVEISPQMVAYMQSEKSTDIPKFKEEWIERNLCSRMRDKLWNSMRDGRSYQVNTHKTEETIPEWDGVKEIHRLGAWICLVNWEEAEVGEYLRKDAFGPIANNATGWEADYSLVQPKPIVRYGQLEIGGKVFGTVLSPTGRLLAWRRVA